MMDRGLTRLARPRVAFIAFLMALALMLGSGGAAAVIAANAPVLALGDQGVVWYQESASELGGDLDTPDVVDNPVTDDPIDLSDVQAMWAVVLGFLSMWGIALINRLVPGIGPDDNTKRGAVAFLFCLAVGVLDTMIRGTLNLTNVTTTVLIIFTSAILFYRQWFAPSGIAAKVENR